jgi:hypothetical protein
MIPATNPRAFHRVLLSYYAHEPDVNIQNLTYLNHRRSPGAFFGQDFLLGAVSGVGSGSAISGQLTDIGGRPSGWLYHWDFQLCLSLGLGALLGIWALAFGILWMWVELRTG